MPDFANPEQFEGREIDVRSDIYSLGVTLWCMLAGQPPFGGSIAQVISQRLSKPPPFEKLKPSPQSVTNLLRKMLEKDPADRFQTPAELRKAIEEVLGKLSLKRKAAAVVLGAAVAMLALCGGGFLEFHEVWAHKLAQKAGNANADIAALRLEPNPKPSAIASNRQELLAMNAADLEQRGDTQAALEGCLKIVKDFPDIGAHPARHHIELLLERLRQKKPPMTRDQFESIRELLVEAAQWDALSAMLLLGDNEEKKNPAEAYQWYSKAAEPPAESPEAMYHLGIMHVGAKGIPDGTEKDPIKAVAYFKKAAEKNYMPAVYALGECYLKGNGVPQDEAKGWKLIRDAAAAKDARAMNRLAAYLTR
jgi:TPR repeat protein